MEPRRGRPKKHELVVSPAQRAELERLARQSRNARSVAFRARIILECAGGVSNAAVAAKLRTTGFTVGLWRNRFIAEGMVGLGDEPRPGAPREIGDEKVEQVVRLTLEKTPKGATHWSSRMLAASTGLSQSTISRIWRAFGLKPHRTESFQLSSDPLLIDKVRDIVGLYLDPPHHALVLCVDEKSQIQALSRTQPVLPMRSRTTGAPHARLQKPRCHQPVCSSGYRHRQRSRQMLPTPSFGGVPRFPEEDRQRCSRGPRYPSGAG